MKMYIAALFLFCLSVSTNAVSQGSGTGCNSIKMGPEGYQKAAQLSSKVLTYLEQKHQQDGTVVAMLGRVGSDSPDSRFQRKVSRYWNYTHAGLAYRNHADGQWTIVHLLNDCGKESNIYAHSMMTFFLDDPYEYRAVVGIPDWNTQEMLETLIVDRNMSLALFNNSVYSSVSYPFNIERQNSNEYILDTLVLAMAYQNGVDNLFTREHAKEYLLSSGLKQHVEPEQVKVKGIESFGMALGFGPKNVTLKDHPRSERRGGKVNIVSVGTLIEFLNNLGKLQATAELSLKDVNKASDTRYEK